MSINRWLVTTGLIAAVAGIPVPAHAVTLLTSTFCVAASNPAGESDTCPEGLGATLQIDDIGGGDPNDYLVTLTLDSTNIAGNFAYISDVQFSIGGASTGPSPTYGDYEGVPTLSTAGVDGGTWTVFFDTISGSVNSCTDDGNGTSTCAASTKPGTDTHDVDTWVFTVDFDDALGAFITGSTATNLRATFLKPINKKGNYPVAGILSPDWKTVNGGGGGGGGGGAPGDVVPEPGSLMLLGTGLIFLGNRARKRFTKV